MLSTNVGKSRQFGFTIVELLIVIVVIAILAAITLVAYNGIRQRAALSALQSSLTQRAKEFSLYQIQNGELYPYVGINGAKSLGLFTDSPDAAYNNLWVSPDQKNYCATATSSDGQIWSISSTSNGPLQGECVTNLLTNPSFETGTGSWTVVNSATWSRPSGTSQSGSYSILVTPGGSNYSGAFYNCPGNSGQAYTASAYVRPVATTDINYALDGLGVGNGAGVSTPPSWQRFALTGTRSSQASHGCFIRGRVASSPAFYVDAVMYTAGPNTYSYGDGDSPGWFWNGTPHNSTSTGPAVAQ